MGIALSKQEHVRYSIRPTIFEKDKYWCRYCGATSNLKEGLCVYECKETCSETLQLDNIPDLIRPLSQQICCKCKSSDSCSKNPILQCDGCPRAIHLKCFKEKIPTKSLKRKWYCSLGCRPFTRNASKRIQENASKRIQEKASKRIQEKASKRKKERVEPSTPPPDLDYNIRKYIKREIETPNWKILNSNKSNKSNKKGKRREDFTDEAFIKRHKKCEELELKHLPPI